VSVSSCGVAGIDFVVAAVLAPGGAHFVESKMFKLRTEIGSIADSGALEVVLRFLRDVANVTTIALSCYRIADVADQHQRPRLRERIQERCGGIGNYEHIAFLDLLETAYRGAVEADAL